MSERARALEQALRELTAMVRGECPSLLNEDSGGNGDLSYQIEKLLAVDPPPSGASPQATGGYIHHSLTDWIPTPGCDCDRCTSARKSAPKPTGGASSQAETVAKLLLAARQVASFARAWEPLSPGDIRDLTKAIEAMDALPAPVSPVEPTTCPKCRSNTRAYRPAVADVIDGRMAGMTSCRDEWHSRMPMVPPVEPEPTTTCHCLDCEPLTDPGPKPSEDDINRLEKAAWDSNTDRVLIWYRDRAEMFRQRLRETERAWQLDRKKLTVEPEPPAEARSGVR